MCLSFSSVVKVPGYVQTNEMDTKRLRAEAAANISAQKQADSGGQKQHFPHSDRRDWKRENHTAPSVPASGR